MSYFTQAEISAIRSFCDLYAKDGFPRPKHFDPIPRNVQKRLITSALINLSSGLNISISEATVLCMAVTHVVNNYEIDGDQAGLIAMYNRLADLAGFPA